MSVKRRSIVALIAGDDILRVTCKFKYSGGDIQNVYHIEVLGTPTDEEEFLDGMLDWLDACYANINDVINDTIAFDSIAIWNLTQDYPVGEYDWPTQTVGQGSGGETLPLQSAPLIRFSTPAPRSQGRKYLYPIMETHSANGGYISAAAQTVFVDFIADILAAFSAGGATGVPGNWNPTLARFAVWIAGLANTYLRTQRRRVRNVGS
jgi:hypothetical protein